MPVCVEEMGPPSGPTEAGQAGCPMAAAGHMSSMMGGLGLTHLDRSKGLLLWVVRHSSSLGPSGHSTCPHGCSREGKEGGAGLGQKEAKEGPKSKRTRALPVTTSHTPSASGEYSQRFTYSKMDETHYFPSYCTNNSPY